MAGKATAKEPPTSEAKLNSAIKSARDVMRKDAGLNGDLDRLPQLSWLLFLKAFDATEAERKTEAEISGEVYEPAIEKPYRWRDWAADPDFTGDELLGFVNNELLPHLKNLHGDEGDPRNVLSEVFKETNNRMLSGVLLRDLITEVDKINFKSKDDIHTMARLYESILKEMRDAAGDSGEFYTPRPVIRFMVSQSFPELGESVLDPACGTGGFLVEAYEELNEKVETAVQRPELHRNIRGIEKKPLPYLLCVMNLILHGLETPEVSRDNALLNMVSDTSPANRVNLVLTNPPFGGEEEDSVAKRFPAGVQTKETAWLFLHGVIEKLKPGGRCAIVLPNGTLFGGGVGARIKKKLLDECNLHTVVRLPQGVFAPYTQIPSNLLFFDKPGKTEAIWFYELPLPEGRKGYTKTKPLREDEFAACVEWWGGKDRAGRVENERAWKVHAKEIRDNNYNLDLSNPNTGDDLAHRPPGELVADLLSTEREILSTLEELQAELEGDQ